MDMTVDLSLQESCMAALRHMGVDVRALIYKTNELEAENAKLRAERDYLLINSNPTAAELRRVRSAWKKDREENAKLREILKSLMMGTNAELCAGRGESDCKECSMYHGEDGCTVVNAMELLGIDMYGEPLGIEVDE